MASPQGVEVATLLASYSAGRQFAGTNRAGWFPTGERTPVDFAWASRSTSSADTALPAGAGRQDPAEQVQVEDQGDDEYQAPPASRGAEHNDDDSDPNCQQHPDHKR